MISVNVSNYFLRSALSVLVVAGMGSLVSSASFAGGSIGGDCCADLEERVAELESTTARKGNKKISLRVSGTINKAILHIDDGGDSDTFVVDNYVVPSRFRFTGAGVIRDGWTTGYTAQFAFSTADTLSISLADGANDGDDGNTTDGALDLLEAFWWIHSDDYGTISVGQATSSTLGITQHDLSGTLIAGNSSKVGMGGSLRFRTDAGVLSANAIALKINPYFEGVGDYVKYDSPTKRGFRFSATWGEDDVLASSVRYLGKLGDFQVLAGVGYSKNKDEAFDYEQISGSASFYHLPSGVSFSFAVGDRDTEGSSLDQFYYYGKIGVKKKRLKMGATAVSVDYRLHEEHAVANEDVEQWGVQLVQSIDAASMALYASYSNTALNNPTTNYQDIDMFMAGARINF